MIGQNPDICREFVYGSKTIQKLQECIKCLDAEKEQQRIQRPFFAQRIVSSPEPPRTRSRVAGLGCRSSNVPVFLSSSSTYQRGPGMRIMHNGWEFPSDMNNSDIRRIMEVNGALQSGHGPISEGPVSYDT